LAPCYDGLVSAVERKLKKIEQAAHTAAQAPCRDRPRLLHNLEREFEQVRNDIDSIRDPGLARKLAGRSGLAVDALYHARRDTERRCQGLGGTRRKRRRK
jgi:hypothetical protein